MQRTPKKFPMKHSMVAFATKEYDGQTLNKMVDKHKRHKLVFKKTVLVHALIICMLS